MKFYAFLYLIIPMFFFGQNIDSTNIDSLSSSASLKYLPLRNQPLQGTSQFGVTPNTEYSKYLKLGQPYRPKTDVQRMDLRGTSNYTPPWVHKQHLMDMGRDPGTFWISPYTLAFIGVAMLERYYLREQMEGMFTSKRLVPENLFACEPYWQILEALWEKSPQSQGELSNNPGVGLRFRGKNLEDALSILIDNQLLESELLTNKVLQYHVSFSKEALEKKIIEMLDNQEYTDLTVRDRLNQILSFYYKKQETGDN